MKKVLSANTEHVAQVLYSPTPTHIAACLFHQVESLIDDVDLKAPVTREEFEGMCGDLFDRIAAPIQQALKSADMTLVDTITHPLTHSLTHSLSLSLRMKWIQ